MTHNLLAQAYRQLGRTDDAKRQNEMAQRLQSVNPPRLDPVK
jgi:Flp pilus assembly protein TadD